MRISWNPETATPIHIDICAKWDRITSTCDNDGGWYGVAGSKQNELIKVATNNYLIGGGDGFKMLIESNVLDKNEFGPSLDKVLGNYISAIGQKLASFDAGGDSIDCIGFKQNFFETFNDFPHCRIVKAATASPYKCPRKAWKSV